MSKKDNQLDNQVFDVDVESKPNVHIYYDRLPQEASESSKHIKHPNIWKHIYKIASNLGISNNRVYHMYRLLVDNYTNYDEWSDDIETILLNAYRNKQPGQTLADAIDDARNNFLDTRSMKYVAHKDDEQQDNEDVLLSLHEVLVILDRLVDEAQVLVVELRDVIADVEKLQEDVPSSKSKSFLRKWLHV